MIKIVLALQDAKKLLEDVHKEAYVGVTRSLLEELADAVTPIDSLGIQAALDELKKKPIGYAINPGPVPIHTNVFAVEPDPECSECCLALVLWTSGRFVYVRFDKKDIVLFEKTALTSN
jgi:hypothetical protein